VPTSFPGGLDTFPAAATLAGQTLGTTPHSTLHGNLGDALSAVEVKVGINGSADTTSLDYRVANLLPPQAGQAGKVLGTSGTAVSWVSAAVGTVTSVNVSGGTTGLTATGGPVTGSGIITLGGVLALASGGTGATTQPLALSALLPAQAGQSGKLLGTDGSSASWTAPANQTITLSGDVTGSGATAITATLAASGVSAGTYNSVTVNAKGLVTGGTSIAYLTGNQTVTLSGDVTGSGSTAITATIAAGAVTYAKLQNVTAGRLLGSISLGAAAPGEVTVGTGLSLCGRRRAAWALC
jgi:hypothetical protein